MSPLPLRVLVTGSRTWSDYDTIYKALERWLWVAATGRYACSPRADELPVLVHGAARGADSIAATIWEQRWEFPTDPHPADWDRFGKAAGHRRNAEMIATKPDVVLAFPIGLSPGTRGCIELARRAGIPVRIYEGTPK